MTDPSPSPDVKLNDRLALERTRCAYENTMMSWIRTGSSLITFGFAVYKFLGAELSGPVDPVGIVSARLFGLALVGLGILTLLAGRLEHRRDLHALARVYPGMPQSGTRLLSVAFAVFGGLVLIAEILSL